MTLPDTVPPECQWKRLWALRHDIPLRWRGGWADRRAKWQSIECNLFHGLPTKAMRAWIEQGQQ